MLLLGIRGIFPWSSILKNGSLNTQSFKQWPKPTLNNGPLPCLWSPQSRVLVQPRPCCWFWHLWQFGQCTRPQCTASVQRPIAWQPAWHQHQSPVKSRHPTITWHLSLIESRSCHLTKRLNRYYSSGFQILLLFYGEPVHPGSPGQQSLPTMLRDSSRNLWAQLKMSL